MADANATTYQKLRKVQMELKAPKGQRNTFGNYNYRSCEDILEAVKPILDKNELTLVISDTIINVGDRNYVKADATVIDTDGTVITVSASAREEESKKGMDASQLTGATSSYARKYALNGLFAIDDTKDADTQDNTNHQTASATNWNQAPQNDRPKASPNKPASDKQKALIAKKLEILGVPKDQMKQYLADSYGIEGDMNAEQASNVIDDLMGN